MKKLLLLLLLASCSKPDCQEEIAQAKAQYEKAMQLAGSNWSASVEVTKQYQNKINQINNNCN
jgi:hypothetical protein